MEINTSNLESNREQWASIDGYRNYEVSFWGRVRNATTARILKCCLSSRGYFVVGLSKNRKSKTHNFHQLVAREWVSNPEEKICVDYIDGNRVNNHYENLRYATYTENNGNRKKQSDSSSAYKGVSWHTATKKWQARIAINRKTVSLGYFDFKREAGEAYNTAARELFKEYAKLNIFED